MTALLFALWLNFPPGCACLQVPAGVDLTPFECEAVRLVALEAGQQLNDGVYAVREILTWPRSGIAVVLLDREPPVADGTRFYRYNASPVGRKRLIFADGFESGGTGAWSARRGWQEGAE